VTPIEIYFCHIPHRHPDGEFRDYLARACLCCWYLDPVAHVVLAQPDDTPPLIDGVELLRLGAAEHFHNARYGMPAARSSGRPYVVADDDCLPLGRNFLNRAVHVAQAHPEYGVLAASDVVAPDGMLSAPGSTEVRDSHAVGGICLVSPSCPRFDFRVDHPAYADGARDAQVRRAGLREGRMVGVRMNHLGYGYSMAVSGHWHTE
jgi:hypothetical protein